MVRNIKTQEELSKLLQQAKNKKISWDEKVKLELKIEVDKFIGEVFPGNWDKIKHRHPGWDGLISQISQSNKLFNNDWKFVDKEKLEKFKEYVDLNDHPTLETRNRGTVKIEEVNENDVVTTSWDDLRKMFKESRKIFFRNRDWDSFQSEDALRFLQSIINDDFSWTIEYQVGEEFRLRELRDSSKVDVQEWLDENYPLVKRAETKELNINKGLRGELNFKELGFSNLEKIDISYNSFEKVDFTGLNQSKLIFLNMENLWERPKEKWEFNLSSLSHFHNLKELYVANAQITGKVEDLKNMQHLECFSYGGRDTMDGKKGNEELDGNQFPLSIEKVYWGNKNSPSGVRTYEGKKKWESKGLSYEEFKKLKEADINDYDYGFTDYLRESCEISKCPKDILQKKYKEYLQVQTWLDFNYPRGNIKELKDILSEDKTKIVKETVFSIPLKKIPSEYWKKVEVYNDWDREYVEAENDKSHGGWEGSRAVPMTFSHGVDGVQCSIDLNSGYGPWYRKFKSQKLLENYKKYIDVNKEIKHYSDSHYGEGNRSPAFVIKELKVDTWFTTHLPTQLTQFLKEGNKLFIKGGYGKTTSKEAFEFLQSIIESLEIKAKVKFEKGEEFDLKEWAITSLDISNRSLEGELNLSEFKELKVLNCENNKLTEIKLGEKNNLEHLNATKNYLTNINTLCSNLNSKKLKTLRIGDNNFAESTLEPFSKFTNLELLQVFSNLSQQKKDVVNRFVGSLKFLKNLSKLKSLSIENTDIDSGVEHLPESLENFDFTNDQKPEAKVKEIRKNLGSYLTKKWIREEHPKENRKNITKLDIIDKNLEGKLDLTDFIGLKELTCKDNNITSVEISKLVNLTKIDLSNCPIEGSLKILKGLDELKSLNISNTNIGEGLEYLPKSCKKLICKSDYQRKSSKIAEKLDKSNCFKDGDDGEGYYDLDEWRIDQANNKTTSSISLERLFVIRSNIKQFINKWNKKEESDNNNQHNSEPKNKLQKIVDSMKKLEKEVIDYRQGNEEKNENQSTENTQSPIQNNPTSHWYDKWLSKKTNSADELSQLQTPEQYGKFRYLGGVKWIARATAATGGILALTDQPVIGGAMAAASPFIDAIASHVEENYYQKKEEKWKEFQNDADILLDNYHELLGITKSIKIGEEGEVNEAFRNLKKEVDDFLKIFDEDENGEIDVRELVTNRGLLFKKGDNSQTTNHTAQTKEQLSQSLKDEESTSASLSITETKKRMGHARNDSDLIDEQIQEEQQIKEKNSLEIQVEQPPYASSSKK